MPQDSIVFGAMGFFRGFRKWFQDFNRQKMIQTVDRIGDLQEGVTYKLISLAPGDGYAELGVIGELFRVRAGVATFGLGMSAGVFLPGFTVERVESETSPATAPPLGIDCYNGIVAGSPPAPLEGCEVDSNPTHPLRSVRELTPGIRYRLLALDPGDVYNSTGLEGRIFMRRDADWIVFEDSFYPIEATLRSGFVAEELSSELNDILSMVHCHTTIRTSQPLSKPQQDDKKDEDIRNLRQALDACITELERRVTKNYRSDPDKYSYLIKAREVLEGTSPYRDWIVAC